MTFYATSETLSELIKSSSADQIQNSSVKNIQDNIVDSAKRIELAGESMNDSPIPEPNSSDYGQDISLTSSSAETRCKEDNDKEEISKNNTEVYTESTNTGETTEREEDDKEETQDTTEVKTENTGTEETSTRQKDAKDEEESQKDSTEVYTESTSTGETSKQERNDEEELQQVSTEVYTESTISNKEDEMDMSSEQMEDKIAETRSDETTTTHNSADVTTTVIYPSDENGMMKDGGTMWFIGEVKSSVESVTHGTSQETVQHEITTIAIEDDKEVGSGTESTQFEAFVGSREGSDEGTSHESTGDDGNKFNISSGELGQNKYDENNPEAGSFENSNTNSTADHTQATEHEPRDSVPVITLQNDMESSHMGIVLPDLDNNKMQVDYDIKKIETNPTVGTEAEINTSLEYNNITNKITADYLDKSELGGKTFQTSNEEESEGITTDESTDDASFTTTPTSEVTSEFQSTETTEMNEFSMGQGKTGLSAASLLTHDSQTEAQDEESMNPTDGSTTPDILEGEHPLNTKEFEQTTEHTQTTPTDEPKDATTANTISDDSGTQDTKAEMYSSDKDISHTESTRESFTDSFGNIDSSSETENSMHSTTHTIQLNKKILDAAVAFKNNKVEDILPKEWFTYDQLTTETNTEAVPQTSPNEDKAEEFPSTINYSHDKIRNSYESKSVEKTDRPVEIDTTKPVWTTESIMTSFDSSETTGKIDNRPSNDDSQTSADELSNEIQTTINIDTDSEETNVTITEHGTSTISDYSLKETKIPFWYIPSLEHSEESNRSEGTDTSSDVTSENNFNINEDSKQGGSDESLNSNTYKKSWAKQPNEFDKIHPESLNVEDKSTDYNQHGSGESVSMKEVKSAFYSGDSYEQSFLDLYGPGDYYVTSSESDLTYNTTDERGEATSTVTIPGSQEQFTESTTVRSSDNEDKESYSQVNVDTDTTVTPTDSSITAATNETESALESTTPRLSENVYNSGEISNLSEIKVWNSLEDSQDAKFENMGMIKVEEALYDASVSNEENY